MHAARFTQSLVLAVAGGFVVVASQAFAASTTAWLAFALGIVAVGLAALPVLAGERRGTLALDGFLAVLGAWIIVASLIFSGTTSAWLSFAEGAAVVLVGIVSLTVDHVRLASARPVSPVATTDVRPAVTPVAA